MKHLLIIGARGFGREIYQVGCGIVSLVLGWDNINSDHVDDGGKRTMSPVPHRYSIYGCHTSTE